MGRPLRKDLLEKMNIKVSVNGAEKTLVKQVGFNKYETEDGSIVTLGKDASLLVIDGEKSAKVIKITKNVLYTDGGFIAAYDVQKNGGIKLLDESLVLSTEVKDDVETEGDGEGTNEPTTNDVTDTVSSSNDDEPVVDDEPAVDEEA